MSLRDTLRKQIEELERGALPLVAATPGERGPGTATDDFRRGRKLGERVAKARLEHSYEHIIEAEREHCKKWRLRAKVAEGELRATRLFGNVNEAMLAVALDGYQNAIDPDGRDKQWRSDEMMLGIVSRGVRGAIEAVVKTGQAKPAAGGTNPLSLELIAAYSAIKAVFDEMGECDCDNANVEIHFDGIKRRATTAYERALDTTVPPSAVSAEKEA